MKATTIILLMLTHFVPVGIILDRERSEIKITGTSSLHDWEMMVEDFAVSGEMTEQEISKLKVKVTAKSMKSGKSIMDGKAYDAVNADKYPTILFVADRLVIRDDQLSGKGEVSLAGTSRQIEFSGKILSRLGTEMRIEGEIPLKMSDFGVEPPTAMFGTLQTGDEVVVDYSVLINYK